VIRVIHVVYDYKGPAKRVVHLVVSLGIGKVWTQFSSWSNHITLVAFRGGIVDGYPHRGVAIVT
jgi:hypothetical protein